jgi:hypothetical protein
MNRAELIAKREKNVKKTVDEIVDMIMDRLRRRNARMGGGH